MTKLIILSRAKNKVLAGGKVLKIVSGVSLSVLVLALTFFFLRTMTIEIKTTVPEPSPAEKSVKLFLAGDIMLDRGVKYMIEKEGQGDFKFPFLKMVDEMKKADLVFGNLESQISDRGTKVGSIYSFRADPKAIEGLKFAGFDVLSLANNHALDYTQAALKDSLDRLIDAGLAPIGAGQEAQAFAPAIKTTKGTRIAFFAYTDQAPSAWQAQGEDIGIARVSENNLERIKADLTLARELADVVIVSLHAGQEYTREPTLSQTTFSRAFIDAGADIVVNHHSHVIQESEEYRSGYIFYGLGNFVFDQGFSKETTQGEIVEITIENKKIKKVITKEIKMNEFFQPELVE
ncbi:MAG: CapA family protein [bacterium]|nr:CapA family protein [bacterium]